MKHRAPLAAMAACLLLCACGQKGPLFLPGDRSEVQTELPPLDRDTVEETLEKDEEATREAPDAERPPLEDDNAEPLIDPVGPRPRSDGDPDDH